MAVLVANHTRAFRPLRGGIAVMNANVRLLGTLGCIATSDGLDRWVVSAYHVLGRPSGTPLADGEPVFQPAVGVAENPVAVTRRDRFDLALDAAAALVTPGVGAVGEVLGLGPVTGLADPTPGMRVVKSGIATGVTEGVVARVLGPRVEIEVPADFSFRYDLSDVSDSGAVWLDSATGRAVALHVAGNDTGVELAIGMRLAEVLASLRLRLV
jgi:hypothetical protein